MKNLHLLPTEKPSRLYKDDNQVLTLNTHPVLKGIFTNGIGSNQNIYITSDEEIKEGWILVNGFILRQVDYIDGYMVIDTTGGKHHNSVCEKIILTTDIDLIKDNVQAIEDDFLEWFVKNPSCEEAKAKLVEFEVDMGLGDSCIEYGSYYEIIIPKEKPKQETIIKYTAIEWLVEQLEGDDAIIARVIGLKKYNEIYKKAKEIEKQQIMEAYDKISMNTAEQYYNETFKNK
jgi:hypothetical protein